MNFKPLHDRIAIKPIAEEDKTSGGIFIPDTAKEKPMKGEVVSVGEGARDANGNIVAMQVKVGDKVLYGKWGGTDVKIDGQEIIIMKESDVLGIIS